jgi:hypothetical protein
MMKNSLGRLVAASTVLAMAVGLALVEAEPAHAATTATINFNDTVGVRSPNIFGGAVNELDGASDVDTLRSVGITYIRRDAYLREILPVTTVAQYLDDLNDPLNPADDTGVTNPANWDWSKYGWVDTYYNKGISTMLIMDYNTAWLAANGEPDGVPTNWTVYEDVVKKIYEHFAGKVSWVEAWNEPDSPNFLDITGSGYATNKAAYLAIYEHFAIGIRRASATIPLGGPSVASPLVADDWAHSLLTTPGTRDNVNFLTYHYYTHVPDGEGTVSSLKATAAAAGKPNMPVYVTEWNYDPRYSPPYAMNDDSVDAIPYVGQRLHDFIKLGAAGTGYFAFNKQSTHSTFYSLYNNGAVTPKMATYRLLSQQLGLGDGPFYLKSSSWSNGSALIVAGGAVAASGKNVAWAVNVAPSGGDQLTFNLNGLKPGTRYTVDLFEASSFQNASSIRETFSLTTNGAGSASLSFWIPFRSVVGIELTDNDTRPDLALSRPAVADSTSYSDVAALAVDGNDSTRWASWTGAGARTLQVDLGSVKQLNEVAINWETAYGVDYAIETSTDGVAWTSRATVTGNASEGLKVYAFGTVAARYVRLKVTAARPTYSGLVSVFSMSVYNDLARATAATATASGFYAGDAQFAPAKAIDNNETTRWASADTAGTHWVQVNLGSPQTVRTVRINWEAAYGQSYTIRLSPNGTTWSTPVTVTGNAGAGWRAYSFTPVANTQYVRVTITSAVTGLVVSAWTVTVH